MLTYSETPAIEIDHPDLKRAGVKLLVKREDLNHAAVSGNKWWKLKYNLEEALHQGHDTLLTFGGAYSNHLYATAAAAKILKLKSIGIIRGEETLPLNSTLQFSSDQGMKLHYISRQAYRDKEELSFLKTLHENFGNFYLIPEGGTNALALKGCEEFGSLISQIPADYVCLPVGTGGTMGGILRSIGHLKTVIGFAVLKNGAFLEEKIFEYSGGSNQAHWKLMTEYAYGGYGKRNATVTEFIETFRGYTDVPLDFVYTGKMMCAVFDLIEKGYFERGKTILAIHTGGLQGHS
ncbi:MAG TPA: pyridoxal-phosphate dependent enzyme [Chryseosolibacter sp.]